VGRRNRHGQAVLLGAVDGPEPTVGAARSTRILTPVDTSTMMPTGYPAHHRRMKVDKQ
jgi:hypothetical protein